MKFIEAPLTGGVTMHFCIFMGDQMSNVAQLHTVKPFRRPLTSTRRQNKALKRQNAATACVAVVTIMLTGLSLWHLATGMTIVTGASIWESCAMAVGIDLGFLSMEGSVLLASTAAVRRQLERFARPAVIGTLTGSAAMNAFAFAAQATGWMLYPAIIFGVAIPALIYAMTRCLAIAYINGNNRA